MKKFIVYIITLLIVVSLISCNSGKNNVSDIVSATSLPDATYEIDGKSIEVSFYDIENKFISDLSQLYGNNKQLTIYDSKDLTMETLESRTERDEIIIERCIGIVTNAERAGDGKILNTNDEVYFYINYVDVDFEIYDGTIILSYFIYNPGTDYVDDIVERYDFVLSRELENQS